MHRVGGRGIKLWLDDMRRAPDASWLHVKTAQVAIEVFGGWENGTGYDVACWRVHSANPVGRAKMADALERADSFWGIDG